MKMKKWIWLATALLAVGCILLGTALLMYEGDFETMETNVHSVREGYQNIQISAITADVEFTVSGNGETTVTCYEQSKVKHTVTVLDGTLRISVQDTRKWYEHIGINFSAPRITVSIPEGEYGSISVKTTTGRIKLGDLSAASLELSATTGSIHASSISCTGDVQAKVTTGDVRIKNIRCMNLTAKGSTGDISMEDVIAEGKLSANLDTGDVEFERCDAGEIYMETDTGDIEGTLLSEKVFIARTDTGDVEVPRTVTGGRCELTTDTGDIEIEIVP